MCLLILKFIELLPIFPLSPSFLLIESLSTLSIHFSENHFSLFKKKALSSSIFVGTVLISQLTKGHALPKDLKFAFSRRNYSIPSSQTHMSQEGFGTLLISRCYFQIIVFLPSGEHASFATNEILPLVSLRITYSLYLKISPLFNEVSRLWGAVCLSTPAPVPSLEFSKYTQLYHRNCSLHLKPSSL